MRSSVVLRLALGIPVLLALVYLLAKKGCSSDEENQNLSASDGHSSTMEQDSPHMSPHVVCRCSRTNRAGLSCLNVESDIDPQDLP